MNPLEGEDVGARSAPAAGDLDGDGDLDLVTGDSGGTFSVHYFPEPTREFLLGAGIALLSWLFPARVSRAAPRAAARAARTSSGRARSSGSVAPDPRRSARAQRPARRARGPRGCAACARIHAYGFARTLWTQCGSVAPPPLLPGSRDRRRRGIRKTGGARAARLRPDRPEHERRHVGVARRPRVLRGHERPARRPHDRLVDGEAPLPAQDQERAVPARGELLLLLRRLRRRSSLTGPS